MAKSKLIKAKQKQRKASRAYEYERNKFDKMVLKFQKASAALKTAEGSSRSYYKKRVKQLDKQLYHQRKKMLKAGLSVAEARGDELMAQSYKDAIYKQEQVRKHPKLSGDKFWHRATKHGISKYDLLERDHRDEIHSMMESGMSYEEATQEVWDNLVSAGIIVQSDRGKRANYAWLLKISDDEYEVISPL